MAPRWGSGNEVEESPLRLEDEDESEEDYMTMVIPEVQGPESSLQRRRREAREVSSSSESMIHEASGQTEMFCQGEIRGRVKSKMELEEDELAKRETALMTPIDASNKGFQMMTKLGYKPGSTLGKAADARTEPIRIAMKDDKSGIGVENEKKRKFREAMEARVKRTKAEETHKVDYREQMRLEREEAKIEGQLKNAQKAIENLENKRGNGPQVVEQETDAHTEEDVDGSSVVDKLPLKSIPVVWRGLIRQRRQQEAERSRQRLFKDHLQRVSEDDSDEEGLLGDSKPGRTNGRVFVEEDVDEEDEELDEFNALQAQERLRRVVEYLRERYHYCFWCMYEYPDEQMEGCPGLTEDEHE